jgi:hypothetical protein
MAVSTVEHSDGALVELKVALKDKLMVGSTAVLMAGTKALRLVEK